MSLKLTLIRNTPVLPALPPWLAMTQGNIYYVKPYSGNDGSHGRDPDHACRSVRHVHDDLMTAGQNDICFLMAESNVSATTTDYQSTMLTWSKDLCHLIGVNCGISLGSCSRIATISTWTSADPLMTVSADGCYIAGVSLWSSMADVSTLGCLKVTGQRNLFERCHIAGMGAATNDISGAYSVLLSGGSCAENEFRNCTIGMDNISLGANANSQILTYGASYATSPFNNKFVDCDIIMKTSSTTNHLFLRVPTTTMQGPLKFIRCMGTNGAGAGSASTTLTYAVNIHAAAGGNVYFKDCQFQATDLAATDEANIFVSLAGAANNTAGIFTLVETT